MPEQAREERLAAAFVELADTLVDDFDVISFLHLLATRCVDLVDVAAAGVILSTPEGGSLEASGSDEHSRRLEQLGVEWGEGPGLDCFRSGRVVDGTLLGNGSPRGGPYGSPHGHPHAHWPRFAPHALQSGFAAVTATPLRLRGLTIGALSLFREHPEPLPGARLGLAQALARLATIGILQQRAVHRQSVVVGQLETALRSRVVIEQAKGALAHRHRISVDEAFTLLRQYARSQRRRLTTVAEEVLDGTADPPLPPAPPLPRAGTAD
ncbi:GAF and ANTAR domain-containing protein [Streptomyces sp. AN091965]|uniref:GAF and ANTAR domain-containing protein n=1 Tax=Streptomyces sp. AN091965 TaxID=2927803 RepID=UPI001F60CE14|nr:GAF and ANTAR domain-containing protein [Streptomyces sp. AN091965]MCI3929186.1 GAF and ANTAR domain-containing protein [Streptomyces sp. AN091965]